MKIFAILIFLLGSITVFSQSSKDSPLRGEIPAKDIDYVNFLPIQQNGLLVFSHSENRKDGKDIWNIERFDKNFNSMWKNEFYCNRDLRLTEYFITADSILDGFFSNNGDELATYTKIKLNIRNGQYSSYNFSGEKNFIIKDFKYSDNHSMVSGIKEPDFSLYVAQFFYGLTLYPAITGDKIYSINPTFLFYNDSTNTQNEYTPNEKGQSEIIACQTDSLSKRYICIYKTNYRKKNSYHLLVFDVNGKMLKHKNIEWEKSKSILTANILQGQNGELFFAGVYAESATISKNSIADGMFFGKIDPDSNISVQFHRFSNFVNALSLLSYKELKRVNSLKKQNKEVEISFNLMLHNKIESYDSTYVLLAELYHPEYHSEIVTDARGYVTHQDVFDGYRYTHALVAAFDSKGDLKWDNVMEINDILVMRLQENVQFLGTPESQALIYYTDGFVSTKVINGSETISQKSSEEIPTVAKDEKVIYEDFGKIYHWYGNYFLISSYQKVMDIHGNKRKVFSFNKLIFD